MLDGYAKKANIGIFVSLVFIVLGYLMLKSVGILYLLCFIISMVFWLYGCIMYVKGKGYTSFLGLLGIFSVLGLIVLAVLPDKNNAQQDNQIEKLEDSS